MSASENVSPATVAVVQVGKGGRGFIVAIGAMSSPPPIACSTRCQAPHPARACGEVTFPKLIGPLGGKRTVTAECVFLDYIADIAVFGAPDNQEEAFGAEAFEALTSDVKAFKIGRMPPRQLHYLPGREVAMTVDGRQHVVKLKATTFPGPVVSEARMLSLKSEWFTCLLTWAGGGLWFDQAAQPVIGGMSGSPIVLPDGSAVGVVCTSSGQRGREGGPNPMLASHFPGWLLEAA